MGHVTHVNESSHTCEWVLSLWMSRVVYYEIGCLLRNRVFTTKYEPHYGVAAMSRLLQIIGFVCKRALWTRRYSAKETYNFKEPTNCSHSIALIPCVLVCVSFICVTWLIHMCDMTHSYVWHDSFICVTCLIHMCDMPHSHVWHASFACVIFLVHLTFLTLSSSLRV